MLFSFLDLPECLVNEFKMQLDIRNRVRQNIMDKYREYEEQVRALKQAEEAAAKNRKKAQKKVVKPSKMPKAPQFLSNDEFPDIYPDFLREEQQEFELFINTFYNPKIFKLSFDEVRRASVFSLFFFCFPLKVIDFDEHE